MKAADIMTAGVACIRPSAPMWRLAALALALLPVTAMAQGPEVGRALAERWCVSCHVIDGTQRSGDANGVPTFTAIATKPTTTEATLRGVLSQPHGRMPDFAIGARDQDVLIAYILSLR